MTKTIVIKNPTDSQVNILLPKFRIDLKIGPKSESDPLSDAVLKHIQPYVKAFKLEVVHSATEVAEAKVAPTEAPKAEVKAPEAAAPVEAPKTEVTEQPAAPAAPAEGQAEAKKYEEGELYGLVKAELVAICTEKGLDAAGTKEDLVKRILESQVG